MAQIGLLLPDSKRSMFRRMNLNGSPGPVTDHQACEDLRMTRIKIHSVLEIGSGYLEILRSEQCILVPFTRNISYLVT